MEWLLNEVPNLKPGRLGAADTPSEQLDQILHRWIAGKNIKYNRMFKDLMPTADEVWEMKTVDIRIFGWMCAPRTFIAVLGGYADGFKLRGSDRAYDYAKKKVIKFRDGLNLDEPKIAKGVFDALVSI
ncbi:MAG: hypothetical protein U1E38_01195 [Rhodospirillales bacterium]